MENKEKTQAIKTDFNQHAHHYNDVLNKQLAFFGEENAYFAEYKVQIVEKRVSSQPKRILEYGCGIGRNMGFLKKYFPATELYGCDISTESLKLAQENEPNAYYFVSGNSASKFLEKFDLIFISCVFHHIEPALRENCMREIAAMLAPGGLVFNFEHNPYNPITRYLVKTCPFDQDAVLLKQKEAKDLFKKVQLDLRHSEYTLYFPAALKSLRFAETWLKYLPFGGQYFVSAIKK